MELTRFFQEDGHWVAEVHKRGRDVLRDALINKGSVFSENERRTLGLRGLLPDRQATVDLQVQRVVETLDRRDSDLGRYEELADLHDRNETLFFRVLLSRLQDLMPIVYTPTVGEASLEYSHIFRRGRGRWITPRHRGHMADALREVQGDIRLIVVTDNERILGLGDQGAGGMVIPIGKLALYTAAAGIHPSQTLPVSLDVGTDNTRLLEDPMYLGYRHPRLRGAEYDEVIEEFVHAVRETFPHALLQWEDFKKGNAIRLLDRYRRILPSFNDDIQGTAAVALAGVLAAGRACGRSPSQERVAILGAGAAGIGIANQIRDAMRRDGLDGDDLQGAIALLDSQGLLRADREYADSYKEPYAWPLAIAARCGLDATVGPPDLLAVVTAFQPTTLIGTSGVAGTFPEEVIREMSRHVEAPAIFPFSNPTSKAEATPVDLMEWTEGRAYVATGSPFEPVAYGDDEIVRISQGNNVYIFPGVGLGALAVESSQVTDSMFTAAALRLAELVSEADLAVGALYPPLSQLRGITRQIAIAVANEAIREGVAVEPGGGVAEAVAAWMWDPTYPEIRPT